jgi:hypothetical protein
LVYPNGIVFRALLYALLNHLRIPLGGLVGGCINWAPTILIWTMYKDRDFVSLLNGLHVILHARVALTASGLLAPDTATLQTLRVMAAVAAAAMSDDEDTVASERKTDYECGAEGSLSLGMEEGTTYTAVGSTYYMASRPEFFDILNDLQFYQSHLPD